MKRTKLYKTLQKLTTTERNDFRRFLQSPYFNVNERVTKMYEILDAAIRVDDEADELDKVEIWSEITDGEFVDVKFRKLCSDTLKLIEKWLTQKHFESLPYYENMHLLNALSDRKLDDLYTTSLNQAIRIGEQRLERSSIYHYYQYSIFRNKYNFTTEFSKKRSRNIDNLKENIEKVLLHLDLFYITEKLRYYCTILSWKTLTKYDAEILLIDEIIEVIKQKDLLTVPSIAVYYSIMMSMLDPDNTEHFYSVKSYLNDLVDHFPKEEVRDIYDSTVSYCIQRVNKGDYEFQHEVLELYKQSLQSEVLFVDDYLSPTTYRNIVFFALRSSEYSWAESFANEYVQRLRPEHRLNALNFSLARIALYRKDYSLVIDLLQKVDYEDIWYNLNAKTLLIASYYELHEYDALESLLNSFKVFISRERYIPEGRKKNYLNLIRFTNQLIKIIPGDRKKIAKLHTEISESPAVSKPWLLSKIEEMKSRRI